MLDEYWYAKANRVSPEAPVVVNKIYDKESKPGGAGNVVENCKALGAEVVLITHPDNKLIKKVRVIVDSKQVARMDFDYKQKAIKDYHTEEHIKWADVVILSDYHKGTLRNPQPIIKLCNKYKKLCIVDPKGKFNKYEGADYLVPNLKEKAEGGDTTVEIIQTMDKDGIFYKGKQYPAQAKEVFDVSGAGDTVTATLAYYADLGMEKAIPLANLYAGHVVSKFGPATTKVVMTNGCFDVLHPGHLHLLKEAKNLGDILIVALNSDESAARIKRKPIHNLEYRKQMLESLNYVDLVIPFDEDTPENIYKSIRPAIQVKGGDYPEPPAEAYWVGEYISIPFKHEVSTTKIIDHIKENY